MKKDFGKILLPFVTPFKENEDVNHEAFAQLINWAIEKDYVDTAVIMGTTGEFFTIRLEERVECFKTAVKAINGRIPIIAGTGCLSTRDTVWLTNEAVDAGIDTALIVAPYYCKPTQDALYQHYMRILNETSADIIIYNIPIFTGINLDPETIGRLASQSKRFIGIKDEAGVNPTQITDYYLAATKSNPDFLIYNGDDVMLMPTISQGAMGIVSGGSLMFGDKVKQVFKMYEEGNTAGCLELSRLLYRVAKLSGVSGRVNPIPPMRYAISLITGIEIGNARMPLDPVTDVEKVEIKRILKETQLL